MKEKKCGEMGTITYRLPNIPETMILLGNMGLNSKKLSKTKDLEDNELLYMAKLIQNISPFITKIDLEINGKKITKYSEVLNEFSMMTYLSEIGGEVFSALQMSEEKKS